MASRKSVTGLPWKTLTEWHVVIKEARTPIKKRWWSAPCKWKVSEERTGPVVNAFKRPTYGRWGVVHSWRESVRKSRRKCVQEISCSFRRRRWTRATDHPSGVRPSRNVTTSRVVRSRSFRAFLLGEFLFWMCHKSYYHVRSSFGIRGRRENVAQQGTLRCSGAVKNGTHRNRTSTRLNWKLPCANRDLNRR